MSNQNNKKRQGDNFQRVPAPRKGFVGALDYKPTRSIQNTIACVLERCLRVSLGILFVTRKDYKVFFEKCRMTHRQFSQISSNLSFHEIEGGEKDFCNYSRCGIPREFERFLVVGIWKKIPGISFPTSTTQNKSPNQQKKFKSIRISRIKPPVQRKNFVGALEYQRARPSQDTIECILARCLQVRLRVLSLTIEDMRAFFEKQTITYEDFRKTALSFSFFNKEIGRILFAIIQNAGYEGNIDDLWLSVFGKKVPSIPTATIATPEQRKEYGLRPWWVTHGARVNNTGQSRKPGSHKS